MSVSSVAPTPFYHDPERLQISVPQPRAQDAEPSGADAKLSMFAEEDEPSFWDVLDVINPLQHIPIINDIYRDLTGDKIGVGARLVGGALFGGPIGLAAASVNCVIEESTGKDVGGHMLALFKDDAAPATPAEIQFAAAPQPAPPPQPVAAEPVNAAAAQAAPVIDLPDTAAAAPAGPPMVFSLNSAQPASVPAAPMTAPAVAQVTTQPLGAPARFLPTPNRSFNATPTPLPAVTVPVSGGSSRSNTPITGRAPNAAMPNAAASAATSAAMQRALAGQPAGHAMAPPVDAGAQTAANPDWFSAAWGQALDKYQQANQLNGKPPATITVQ